MTRVFAHRPSPAMLVALLALFCSLGGSAYAALSLPKNSVGTRQLKNRSVTTKKIKNGAVTPAKLNLKGLTVPAATYATSAGSATNATNAINAANATSAASAVNATSAANAADLGGEPPSAYAASSLFGGPASFSQGSATDSSCVVGEIKLYAGIPPAGVMLAAGQVLSISSYPALFTALGGNTYGGNGTTTFALPDLRGAEPKGQGSHGVSYYICTQGLYP